MSDSNDRAALQSQVREDAERYRAWRKAVATNNGNFLRLVSNELPDWDEGSVDESRIDAAIDHARKSRDRDLKLCEEALEVEMQHSRMLRAEIDRKSRGEVVVTKDDHGRIVAVTRQDREGRILKVIAISEGPQPAEPVDKSKNLQGSVVDKAEEMQGQPAEPVKGPSDEQAEFTKWAEVEYRNEPEYTARDYRMGLDAWRQRARYGNAAQPAEKPVDPELIAAVQEAAKARSPFAIAEDGAAVLINYGDEENRMVEHEENACPHCGGSGHKEDVQTAAISEPLVRYCPGCGSIGTVEGKYRDCCPDGNEARLIPQALAEKCRDTFQVAIRGMLAEQASNDAAPIAAQPSVPEGWELVPIKPTREMIAQGYDKLMSWDARTGNDIGIWDMYAAMLEAAPTPPAGDQEVRTHE